VNVHLTSPCTHTDLFNNVNMYDASEAVAVKIHCKCRVRILVSPFLDNVQVRHDIYHNMRFCRSSPRQFGS
jgi:hypothetical protein